MPVNDVVRSRSATSAAALYRAAGLMTPFLDRLELNECVLVAIGQGPKEHRVHDAEYRRCRANAQGKRQQDDSGHERRARECPDGNPHVGRELLDPERSADAPVCRDVLTHRVPLRVGDVAEFSSIAQAPGFAGIDAARGELGGAFVDPPIDLGSVVGRRSARASGSGSGSRIGVLHGEHARRRRRHSASTRRLPRPAARGPLP